MIDVIQYVENILRDDPSITPEEMLHNLHCSNYSFNDCITAVEHFFHSTADEMCVMAVSEFKHPLVTKDALTSALLSVGISQTDADKAVQKNYPSDTNRYALSLTDSSLVSMPYSDAYNVGTGDFTVEAWICKTGNGGTIVSRKPTEGCAGNGGFLLVIKSDGSIKLATDDGYGFYEINSDIVSGIFDGKYHHVLGLRRNSELEIYVDFKKISSTPRTNRFPGLNINNSLRLAVGCTDQIQEPYNHYTGKIGEIRLWSKAKTYTDKNDWENTDYISLGLIGMWAFNQKQGEDYSSVNNPASFQNVEFETWEC